MTIRRRAVDATQRHDKETGIPLASLYGHALTTSSTLASTATATTAATYATKDTTSTVTLLPFSPSTRTPASAFTPTSSLQIEAYGKARISFPSPSSQLSIPIISPDMGLPVYSSIRPKRCSGSCQLVRAGDDSAAEMSLAQTTYRFGPGQSPVVQIGSGDDDGGYGGVTDEFEMVGKSLLTRTVGFESRRWGRFEWRYADRRERAEWDTNSLLVLEKIERAGDRETRVRVAQLLRNEAYRTPGTRPSSAGNGGRLQMALCAEDWHAPLIDEVTVVVTCLVMLKKEVDRLRMMQIMVISSAARGAA